MSERTVRPQNMHTADPLLPTLELPIPGEKPISRRIWLKRICGGAAAVVGYTFWIEPFWVDVVRRPLPIAKLPQRLVGRTLVQLSDLHVGPQVSDKFLRRCFRLTKSLEPDYVVITGDYLTLIPNVGPPWEQLEAVLPEIPNGRYGTVGILGNHDYGKDWFQNEIPLRLCALLEDRGVRVLRNAWQDFDGLRIAGLDDVWGPKFHPEPTLKAWDPQQPSLVLCHNPDAMDKPIWQGYQGWTLSGHTHGGQCKPPFLPPPLLPVRNLRYTAGEFAIAGGRNLYINRGLGHLMAVRFNARPEITLFTLVPQA